MNKDMAAVGLRIIQKMKLDRFSGSDLPVLLQFLGSLENIATGSVVMVPSSEQPNVHPMMRNVPPKDQEPSADAAAL